MRKRQQLLALLLLFCTTMQAQQTFDFTFNLEEFMIDCDDGVVTVSTKLESKIAGGPGAPGFPYFPCRITLPDNVENTTYTVDFEKTLLMANVQVGANPGIITTNGEVLESYTCAQESVTNPVFNGGVVHIRDWRYLYLKVSPFLYEDGNLYFVPNVSISVPPFPDEAQGISFPVIEVTDTVDYLIITSKALASSFKELLDWKELKGLNTKLIKLDEIYSSYMGSDNQLKIKKCIQDYAVNHLTKWVLLGGDNSVVPARYCPVNSADTPTPADLYYACFGGAFNWDANGNGTYGEVDDNIVFNPKVYLSRLPVRTTAQVEGYVTKLLRYERDVTDMDAAGRLLLMGYMDATYAGANFGNSSAQAYNDKLYNIYIANYWDGVKYYMCENSNQLPDGASHNASSTAFKTEIDRGYNLIHECSHGETDKWGLHGTDYYGTGFAVHQANAHPSVIVTNACFTNAFDSEPCLSESLLRNPDGGAVAYFGSSRLGYGKLYNGKLYWSFCYDGCFFKNLLRGKPTDAPYSFASVAAQAKFDNAEEVSDSMYRWLQFSINPMGDPEMPIYTEAPSLFNYTISGHLVHQEISMRACYNQSGIKLYCPAGCTVVAKYTDGSKYVYRNTNHAYINHVGTCDIAVLKHNYVPYVLYGVQINESPVTPNHPWDSVPIDARLDIESAGGQLLKISLSAFDEDGDEVEIGDDDIPNGWSLVITNVTTGATVFSGTVNDTQYTVSTAGWQSGVYAFTALVNGETLTQKIYIN